MAARPKDPAAPLLTETARHLHEAYGLDDHAKWSPGSDLAVPQVVDYAPLKLSSYRVFCVQKGTILGNPVLVVEQLIITVIFAIFAVWVYVFFKMDYEDSIQHDTGSGKDVSVRRWLAAQEPKMRAFAMVMTGLASFLLTFYMMISLSRWWTIRTAGIGGIKAATAELELFIYQQVTQEEEVLSAIRRYGRASLILVFLWRQNLLANKKAHLVSADLLTESECDKLDTWGHCLHETIWGWQLGIVTMLYNEGKIKNDKTFGMLLERVSEGRSAVQLIHTYLAVRIPMQYVHLLGLLVKMHNFVIALIMGALFGASLRNKETIVSIQLFARTLLLPFLFNAILLIAAQLSDPFQGKSADFPGSVYEKGLEKDCSNMVKASQLMPNWLATRFSKEALPKGAFGSIGL